MASRRNRPPTYEERSIRAPEVIHRGLLPTRPHPIDQLTDALADELALQEAEMERLISDNRKLASAHLSMRQDLVAAQQEGDRIREHIKNIETEGDIEIKILLGKIVKLEADVRAEDAKKKELQELLDEARSLATERIEMSEQIQQASRELEDTLADIRRFPEMQAELESLRQEHHMLRKTFEREKGVNTDKVELMKNLEKDLIHLTEQVERRRSDFSSINGRRSV